MPRPPILDLLKAVNTVAPTHREVAVWWYVPPAPDPASTSSSPSPAELVLETDRDAAADLDAIRTRLAGLLGNAGVVVRPHRGAAEPNHLYRLLSRQP